MARAKRTDRAEARRRYRATLIDEPLDDSTTTTSRERGAGAAAGPRAPRTGAPPAPPAAGARPSVMGAFRRPSGQPTFVATSPPCPA